MDLTLLRLRHLLGAVLVLSAAASHSAAVQGEGRPGPWREWRTLATAQVRGDTVIVRGAFVHRGPADGDSTFASYRIEGRDGRLWASDSLPGFEHGLDEGGCDLGCRVMSRDGGFAAILEAGCWPSYPDIYPSYEYVIATGGAVARSEWTDVEWDPNRGDSAGVWIEQGCVSYLIPLAARVEGGRVTFVLRRPGAIPESEEFWVPAGMARCVVFSDADTIRSVDVFTSADSDAPVRMSFRPGEGGGAIEVRSAIVRVSGTTPETLSLVARRIEVLMDGRRVFAAPAVMGQLGYEQP